MCHLSLDILRQCIGHVAEQLLRIPFAWIIVLFIEFFDSVSVTALNNFSVDPFNRANRANNTFSVDPFNWVNNTFSVDPFDKANNNTFSVDPFNRANNTFSMDLSSGETLC